MHKTIALLITLAIGTFTTPAAHAQWAVVDVGAIAQLVQQVAKMEEQLTTMQAHLRQAEQEYQSITGDRGMQNLLSGTVRNYLPADWQSLQAAITQTSSEQDSKFHNCRYVSVRIANWQPSCGDSLW